MRGLFIFRSGTGRLRHLGHAGRKQGVSWNEPPLYMQWPRAGNSFSMGIALDYAAPAFSLARGVRLPRAFGREKQELPVCLLIASGACGLVALLS